MSSFFSKVSSIYEKGKEKVKAKFKVNNNAEKILKDNIVENNQNLNEIKQIPQIKKEDMFKIEDEEGNKEVTFKIQDVDSDSDEEEENNTKETKDETPRLVEEKKEKFSEIIIEKKDNKGVIEELEEVENFIVEVPDIFTVCHRVLLKVHFYFRDLYLI